MAEKTRYSDAELEEFRAIINEKLELAQRDYELLKSSLTGADGNDTDDTSPTYKVLEEHIHDLAIEERSVSASFGHERGYLRMGAFIEQYTIKHTVNDIAQRPGQNQGDTDYKSGLHALLHELV